MSFTRFHTSVACLAAAALLATPSLVSAAVIDHTITEQNANEKTFVLSSAASGAPYYTSSLVWVRQNPGETHAFAQWDLDHEAGRSIDSVDHASFLLVHAAKSTAVGNVYRIYRLTEAFDQTQIDRWQHPDNPNSTDVLGIDNSAFIDVQVTNPEYHAIEVNVAELLKNNGDSQTFGVRIELLTAGENHESSSLWVQNGSDSKIYQLNAEYSTVPEPSALGLLPCGVLAIARGRRTSASRRPASSTSAAL